MQGWLSAVSIAAAVATTVAALAVEVILSACYYPGAGAPTSPSSDPTPSPTYRVVTISENGVAPAAITARNVSVEFVNQDSQAHDIQSNPHPAHTECAELNVGVIEAGQRVLIGQLQLTQDSRACGYHDETRPDDARFHGSITSTR